MLHNSPDESHTIEGVAAVDDALRRLGYSTTVVPSIDWLPESSMESSTGVHDLSSVSSVAATLAPWTMVLSDKVAATMFVQAAGGVLPASAERHPDVKQHPDVDRYSHTGCKTVCPNPSVVHADAPTELDSSGNADVAGIPFKYWAQRYRYFSRFDDGIALDAESWYSVTPV